MPKKATFDNTYPTLRDPINAQKKQRTYVALRERPFSSISNIKPLETVVTPNLSNHIDFINQDTVPKYIRNTFGISDNNKNDLVRMLETENTIDKIDNLQNFNFNDDFSFPPLRPTSPAVSMFDSDDEEEQFLDSDDDEEQLLDSNDEDNDDLAQNIDNRKKYYDINTELPGYTGDSGPYFPSLTTMWMFIWFTKNNIGNIR